MQCPFCDGNTSKVIDSRDSGDGIRRRRECLTCNRRYTTYELVQMRAMMVVKRDNRREEFHRDKLWVSVTKACAKRPLPFGSIEKILEEIESELSELGRAEITTRDIGELVMDRLRNLDRVAYIRYASVYRDFRDIERFKHEIEALIENRETDASIPANQLSLLGVELSPVQWRMRNKGSRKRRQAKPA